MVQLEIFRSTFQRAHNGRDIKPLQTVRTDSKRRMGVWISVTAGISRAGGASYLNYLKKEGGKAKADTRQYIVLARPSFKFNGQPDNAVDALQAL